MSDAFDVTFFFLQPVWVYRFLRVLDTVALSILANSAVLWHTSRFRRPIRRIRRIRRTCATSTGRTLNTSYRTSNRKQDHRIENWAVGYPPPSPSLSLCHCLCVPPSLSLSHCVCVCARAHSMVWFYLFLLFDVRFDVFDVFDVLLRPAARAIRQW